MLHVRDSILHATTGDACASDTACCCCRENTLTSAVLCMCGAPAAEFIDLRHAFNQFCVVDPDSFASLAQTWVGFGRVAVSEWLTLFMTLTGDDGGGDRVR